MAIVVGIAARDSGGPHGRLGSVRVSLVGTDFGVAHVLPLPGWWDRLLTVWFNGPPSTRPAYSTRTPNLGLWIRSSASLIPGAPPGSWEITDAHGCRFPLPTWGAWYQIPRKKGGIDWVESAAYDAFPRGDRLLRIAYYQKGAKEPTLLWTTWNPAPAPARLNLVPQPYPIHFRAQGCDFILRRIVTGSIWERPVSLADFSTRDVRTGTENKAWRVASITAADAFGNRATTRVRPGAPAAFQAFCMRDDAWKLDTVFAPPPEAMVTGQWDWEPPRLRIPSPTLESPTNSSVTRGGVTLRVVSVRSPRWRAADVREITVRVVSPNPVQVSLARAFGESGRLIQTAPQREQRAFVHPGGSADYRLTLVGVREERSVRALLRVQPLITATYTAKP